MSETAGHRGRLIIVDDEPVILDLLASLFADTHDVVPCSDGRTALQAMEEGGVDVMLTDKNLPDMGGLELLGHAKRIRPDAEVLLITGYASLDTALAALQLGAFDYIIKPPKSIFDVKRKVEQAFEKQAVVRENERLVAELRDKNLELVAALARDKQMQAELIQSEKLAGIGTLAAGVAHEISSPLFGVLGLAEAIAEEDDLAAAQEYAREIVSYSKSIKEIVVQLSGYSRSTDREYLAKIELAKVVRDAVLLVQRSMGLGEGRIDLELADDVYLSARTGEVQQVFVNLVKNALEATEEEGGGQVSVTLIREGDTAVAVVADQGPGIAPEVAKLIFDPFYTTKPPGKGTGLGLNIVYRLVTRYRGTIVVESAPGDGTRFVLRFPIEG